MRLEPIEKPKGFLMRIAYWMARRQLGRVITPMKVMYPRMPGVLRLSYEIQKFEMKGLRLEPELHFMVGILAAQINGCSFCVDIGRAVAIRQHLGMEKFNVLSEYRTSPSSPIESARRWLTQRKSRVTSASPTPRSMRSASTSASGRSWRSHG